MTWAKMLEQLQSMPVSDVWGSLKQICDGLDRADIKCTIPDPSAPKEDKEGD